MVHEGIHQKHRTIAKNVPFRRVKSEPSRELFNIMEKTGQVKNDFTNMVKNMGGLEFEERPTLINERKKLIKEIKTDPFSENLAYYTDYFKDNAITNPRNKTEKLLNRMWFE